MSRQQEPRSERGSSPGRTVEARQLWSGGAATAVIAALMALAGILVCRWLFNIPVLAPRQDGAGDTATSDHWWLPAQLPIAGAGELSCRGGTRTPLVMEAAGRKRMTRYV